MSIFERASSILSANVNSLLDKCEDPAKMADQYLREALKDFAEVKVELSKVMAIEKDAERNYRNKENEVNKLQEMAKNAVIAGNDNDARIILQRKSQEEQNLQSLRTTYEQASNNTKQLRAMYDKLHNDINSLKQRRQNVKTQMSMAKAQERVNKLGSSADRVNGALGAFARMEEQAQQRLDMSSAYASIDTPISDPMDSLEAKYGSSNSFDTSIEDELAKLKSSIQ